MALACIDTQCTGLKHHSHRPDQVYSNSAVQNEAKTVVRLLLRSAGSGSGARVGSLI
jgi:hypothetical protein